MKFIKQNERRKPYSLRLSHKYLYRCLRHNRAFNLATPTVFALFVLPADSDVNRFAAFFFFLTGKDLLEKVASLLQFLLNEVL
jgi:hypothetical protein